MTCIYIQARADESCHFSNHFHFRLTCFIFFIPQIKTSPDDIGFPFTCSSSHLKFTALHLTVQPVCLWCLLLNNVLFAFSSGVLLEVVEKYRPHTGIH